MSAVFRCVRGGSRPDERCQAFRRGAGRVGRWEASCEPCSTGCVTSIT
jgi:hypothetical protein